MVLRQGLGRFLWGGAVTKSVLIGSWLIVDAAAAPVSSTAGLAGVTGLRAEVVATPAAISVGGLTGDFCCG